MQRRRTGKKWGEMKRRVTDDSQIWELSREDGVAVNGSYLRWVR